MVRKHLRPRRGKPELVVVRSLSDPVIDVILEAANNARLNGLLSIDVFDEGKRGRKAAKREDSGATPLLTRSGLDQQQPPL